MDKIAFIGLGTMGHPMVRNLAASGAALSVFDVDADAVRGVAEETGAMPLASTAEAAAADVVVLMLPDSAIVAKVLGDVDAPGSLAHALRPGTLLIDMGSSSPEATASHADALAGRGVTVVDAPVSGGPRKAVDGTLTIMMGGTETGCRRALPILRTMGTSVTYVGPAGSAHALKSLNNLLSAIGLVGAIEVLTVGKRFGLDPRVMLGVINQSTGRNQSTEVKVEPQILDGGRNVGFSLPLTVKDISTALGLAHSQNVATPLSETCVELCRTALAALQRDGISNPDQADLAVHFARTTGTSLLP
ncbi:NAD(P)-dependent oxidoreductase [Streptomyces sp. NPDC004542]|uniref:NAD(P)-dependent oxidoreductase n=1 Tax=Streptomyces sp. NPDC004542 TaxID=3154281 RepID=UPI0033A32C91